MIPTSATRRSSWRLRTALVAALMATPLVGPAPAHAAPTAGSQVFIVQGVPDAEVDVQVDGRVVDRHVATRAVVGPVGLPAGRHTIRFSNQDWTVETSFDATSPSLDVVLHWPADPARRPDTTVFTNDTRPIAPGKGRLTIAHTAVVPPADVRVDEKVLFANIANGEFVTADVPADTYPVDIVPTGTSTPLLGPVDLDVKADALTRVFAIGRPQEGSMDAIVQVVSLGREGSHAPRSVRAGSAGLVSPGRDVIGTTVSAPGGDTEWGAAALVAVAIALVVGGRRRAGR